jgi:hypothetical protein
MPLTIEQGGRYRMQGSEAIVEVLIYVPGSHVKYHVVEPIENAAVLHMDESDFRRYALIEETGMTEAEEQKRNAQIFEKHMQPVNLGTAEHVTDLQEERGEKEAEASQNALDEIGALDSGGTSIGGGGEDSIADGNGEDTLAGTSGRDTRKGKHDKHRHDR